jgi:hypothetical protein
MTPPNTILPVFSEEECFIHPPLVEQRYRGQAAGQQIQNDIGGHPIK